MRKCAITERQKQQRAVKPNNIKMIDSCEDKSL